MRSPLVQVLDLAVRSARRGSQDEPRIQLLQGLLEPHRPGPRREVVAVPEAEAVGRASGGEDALSLIHISEPTRLALI
eukprot:6465632-Alexandrium_andersonii.AAC.1